MGGPPEQSAGGYSTDGTPSTRTGADRRLRCCHGREHVHGDLRAAAERCVAGDEDIRALVDRGGEMNRVRRTKTVPRAYLRRPLDDRRRNIDDARRRERGIVLREQRGISIP